ncbi:hypothetical protein F4821DRAFT_266211 [Hypoxylon rubiginosum]|uniref:Uncharacterized protein n=1 Tax=Hypoxylon rubiginosum TaxID=110542 RepID=A0ACC0CI63_9PEZI|nr:hypothetical protein F4821DRAFT_266211 [Hypoxylon rubiginosum]
MTETQDNASHLGVEEIFYVDKVLGVGRNEYGEIELLLQWSKTEMSASEIAQWANFRCTATPKRKADGRDVWVVDWEPTWATRDELGPELLGEFEIWEQLLERKEKRSGTQLKPNEPLILLKKGSVWD